MPARRRGKARPPPTSATRLLAARSTESCACAAYPESCPRLPSCGRALKQTPAVGLPCGEQGSHLLHELALSRLIEGLGDHLYAEAQRDRARRARSQDSSSSPNSPIGLELDTKAREIRAAMKGIRKTYSAPQAQAEALKPAIVRGIPTTQPARAPRCRAGGAHLCRCTVPLRACRTDTRKLGR